MSYKGEIKWVLIHGKNTIGRVISHCDPILCSVSLKNYSADNYSVLQSLMTMNVFLQIKYNTSLPNPKRPNQNLQIMYSTFLIYKKDDWFKNVF